MMLSGSSCYQIASGAHLDMIPRALLLEMVGSLAPDLKEIGGANRAFLNTVSSLVRAGHGGLHEVLRSAVAKALTYERIHAALETVTRTHLGAATDEVVLHAARLTQKCVLLSNGLRDDIAILRGALEPRMEVADAP